MVNAASRRGSLRPGVRPARAGGSSLGCLFTLLVVATVLYFGLHIFEVYWRYYQFEDALKQEVRFAANNTDTQIKKHLRAIADSLGLPEDAGQVSVVRHKQDISIDADYFERIEWPLHAREHHFTPHAEGSF